MNFRIMLYNLRILAFITSSFIQQCFTQGNGILEYTIYEENGANQFVGNLKSDSDLASRHPPSVLNELVFSFRYATSNYALFKVGDRTGVVRTRESLDRDALCGQRMACDLELDVTVRPVQYFEIIKLRVRVLDINDNAPQFPQSHITRVVSESIGSGALIPVPPAQDLDSAQFGVQRYELQTEAQEENHMFALQVVEHADGSMDIDIILLENLDHEVQDFYSLTVRAYDGDSPPRTGSIAVDITVTDSNDNNPKFDNATYETTVFENAPLLTIITRVHAFDPDSGPFGQVLYSFAPNTPESILSVFGINNTTGEIFIIKSLDYEVEKSYTLTIQAQDMGANSLSAFTRVSVRIVDVNDLAPQVSVNTLTSSGEAQVAEGEAVATFVAHLSVHDPDEDGRQRFNCHIDNTLFDLVELPGSNKEYKIITDTVFDREDPNQGSEQEITLHCADMGDPPLTSREHLVVHVLDINDHAPYFAREYYFTTMRENNSHSDFVIKMQAIDDDAGRNAAITYSAIPSHPSEQHAIRLDPISGVVTANITFDFESRSNYQYTIIAKDHGERPKSGTTQLNITILDINDEPPIFDMKSPCNLPIEEGEIPGTLLGSLTASDRDESPFDVIKYSLDSNPIGSEDFRIDQNTGELFSNKVLDREIQAVYHLVIIASNDGYPIIQSHLNCTIHVIDVNDNPPVIDFPNPSNNSIEIGNTLPVDSVITRIRAHDADQTDSLRFAITSGNEEAYVHISEASGALRVARDLSDITRLVLHLDLMVMDSRDHVTTGQLRLVIDAALAAAASSNDPPLPSQAITAIGALLGLLLVIVLIAVALWCVARGRRRDRAHKHSSHCDPGTHSLSAAASCSSGEDVSSDCSATTSSSKHNELTFTFDRNAAYMHRATTNPFQDQQDCTCRYSDRAHPHHSDPRKEMEFGLYDRSPVQRLPSSKTSTTPVIRARQAVNKRNADNTGDKSLEGHDVLNISNHTDLDSECSGTDSGRGASEEGDHVYATHPSTRQLSGSALYAVPEMSWGEAEQQDEPHSTTAHARLPRVEPLGMYKAGTYNRPPVATKSESLRNGELQNRARGRALDLSAHTYAPKIIRNNNNLPVTKTMKNDSLHSGVGKNVGNRPSSRPQVERALRTSTHSPDSTPRQANFTRPPDSMHTGNANTKKAVQFADDIAAKERQVTNMRGGSVHSHVGSTSFTQGLSQSDSRASERQRTEHPFYDDTDCLSYSVV